jgi:hypothetical protein
MVTKGTEMQQNIVVERLDESSVIVKRPGFDGLLRNMTIKMPIEPFMKALMEWQNGFHIQDVFPELTKDEREFLISGTTPEEWDEIFKGEEK